MNKQDKLQAQRNELFDHSTDTLARIKELDVEIQAVIDKKAEPEVFKIDNTTFDIDSRGHLKIEKGCGEWWIQHPRKMAEGILGLLDQAKQAKVGEKAEVKDEPKLRHGDYFGDEMTSIVVFSVPESTQWDFRHTDGSGDRRTEAQTLMHIGEIPYLGNLFDDLTGTSDGFTVSGGFTIGFQAKVGVGSLIKMKCNEDSWWNFNLEEAQEIHRKLGHVLNGIRSKHDK